MDTFRTSQEVDPTDEAFGIRETVQDIFDRCGRWVHSQRLGRNPIHKEGGYFEDGTGEGLTNVVVVCMNED